MWVFTTKGFFSVVEHREDPSLVLVRARTKDDLLNLLPLIAGATGSSTAFQIEEPRVSDYAARIIMPRNVWQSILWDLGEEIDYDNFKDAVKKVQGKKRADVYMRVWGALLSLQDRVPWAGAWDEDPWPDDHWFSGQDALPFPDDAFEAFRQDAEIDVQVKRRRRKPSRRKKGKG